MTNNTSDPQPEINEIVIAPPAEGQEISLKKLLEGKQGLYSDAKPVDKITFEDGLYLLSEPLVIDRPITLVAKNPAKAILKNEVITNLITFTGEGKLVLTGIVFMLGNPRIKTNVIIMKSGTLEMSMCGVGGGFDPDFGKRDFGAGLLLLGSASASVANTYFTMNLLGVSLQGSSNAALVKNTFVKNRYGVVLRDKANGNLQSNELKENFETGVMVYDQAVLTSIGDSSHNNKQGIGFLFNAKATIENAACYENEYHGFFINDSSQVTLKGCKSYSNAYSGIAIYGDSHSEIQDCECYKNALSGFEIAEQAITLLKHNKIHKNKDAGVYLDNTAKVKILDSEIFENNTGVWARGTNTVKIEECQVHRNSKYLVISDNTTLIETENLVFDNPPGVKETSKVEVAKAHLVRAWEYKESKDFAVALRQADLAKRLTPDDKLPYEMAFAIYYDMQDWQNGIANLLEVIRIKPDDVMAHMNLGVLKTQIGDLEGAVDALRKATQLDPEHAASHRTLGTVYLMQSKYDLARESLTRSIELDPSIPVAYLHRANVSEKLGDHPGAIPDYEKYCEMGGSSEVPDLAPLREHITYLKQEYGNMATTEIESEESTQEPGMEAREPNLGTTEKNPDSLSKNVQPESVETSNSPVSETETWMQMGKDALKKGLYPDAVLNFDKVIKKEPNNWEALIYYCRGIGGQTDFENEAWDFFFESINQIKSYILNRLTGDERKEALMFIAESVHWYTDLYMNLVKERRDKRLLDLDNQTDVNTLIGCSNMFFGGIGRLEDSLTFLDSMGEIEFQAIKHAINKSKIKWITTLCEPVKARMRDTMDGFVYVGIPDDFRSKYIAKYESILDEIVKVEPAYKPEKLIDRLKAPVDTQEALNRPAELAKKQISIDEARQIRIAEYEKQKYWETHPEEYSAYLEEEKRKKEEEKARALAEEQRKAEERKVRAFAEQKRKQEQFEANTQKLSAAIREGDLELEKLKQEINPQLEQLKKDRDKLGLLAFSKKKELERQILTLENRISELDSQITLLREQLKNLKA